MLISCSTHNRPVSVMLIIVIELVDGRSYVHPQLATRFGGKNRRFPEP
jgi:hypothetical protein